MAHLVVAVGRGVGRQLGCDQRQVEGAGQAEGGRHLDRAGPAGEAPGLLVARTQVGGARRRQPPLDLVEAAPGPHRGQGGGQAPPGRGGVVDVVGGHERQPGPGGQGGEGVVAGDVERVAVVAQLDGHVGRPELVDQAVELVGGGRRPVVDQGPGHEALAAPGEHQPVALVHLLPVDARVVGLALLAPGQLAGADGGGQAGVALRPPGQHQQVVALGVGLAVLRLAQAAGQLGAEDRGHPHRPGRLGEADDPVEPVVVGQRQRAEAQAGGLLRQLLGVAGPVEEAEVGVAVQLGVGRRPGRAAEPVGGLVLGPPVGPGRAVAPVGAVGHGRAPARHTGRVGQHALELTPRHAAGC